MLRLLPPMFKTVLQQIRLLTGLNMGGKMRNITIQLVLHAAMLQNKLHVVCCPFSVPLMRFYLLTFIAFPTLCF